MIEITPNVFIGNEADYEFDVQFRQGWSTIHACKEPYHRAALGYTGRACSTDNPEYLLARRDNRLMLNLVDVDNPDWISPIIIDAALAFIDEQIALGQQVLVHCNQGQSRAAGIGLIYLAGKNQFSGMTFEQAEEAFIKIYPDYSPALGVRGFCSANWEKYRRNESEKG